MKYKFKNEGVVKLQDGKSVPSKRTQKLFDNVTSKILQNDSAKNKNISSTTGIRYEQPLKDIHPGLDLALAYAQPGNIVAKAFAPSMAKGFVEGLKEGDLQQAIISGLVPESKATSIVKSVKKPISKAERLGIPKGERSNSKALEDPYYWGYKQWNDRYNAAVESGNVKEGRRLIDLHEARNAPDTKVKGDQFHGTNNREFNEMNSTKNPGRTVGAGSKLSNFFSDVDTANAYLIDAQGMGTAYNGPGRIIRARLNIKNPYIFDYEGAKFNGIGGSAKKYNYLTETFTDVQNSQLKYFPTESDFIKQWRSKNKYLGEVVYGKDYIYIESKVKPTIAELVDNIDRNVYDGAIIKNITELDTPIVDYVTFTPNQVKLSNLITYDNYGNMIPIIKRHNYHIKDMRFKQGGVLKGQQGISYINNVPSPKDSTFNIKPIEGVNHQYKPVQPVQNSSKFKQFVNKIKFVLDSVNRPKAIGTYSFAYKQPTRIVENGGNMS